MGEGCGFVEAEFVVGLGGRILAPVPRDLLEEAIDDDEMKVEIRRPPRSKNSKRTPDISPAQAEGESSFRIPTRSRSGFQSAPLVNQRYTASPITRTPVSSAGEPPGSLPPWGELSVVTLGEHTGRV